MAQLKTQLPHLTQPPTHPFLVVLPYGLSLLVLIPPNVWCWLPPHPADTFYEQRDPRSAGHPFGFDKQGCDIYARTVYGARASVL
ncbi:hypothetical protein AB0M45_27880, partial [Nocardia sp. NPDC051787]